MTAIAELTTPTPTHQWQAATPMIAAEALTAWAVIIYAVLIRTLSLAQRPEVWPAERLSLVNSRVTARLVG